MQTCPHEFIFGGLCAACGKDVSHTLSKQAVKLASIDKNIHVSKAVASNLEQESYATLLKKRKLLLVCDLDNTLICAQQGEFKRPGVEQFLEKIGKLFEFSLYTLGGKDHATNSLNIIDPHRKHFKHVVSREALESDSKRLDYLVVDPRTVLILDDNIQVWPHQLKNLIVSTHYVGSPEDSFLHWVVPLLQRLHSSFFANLDSGSNADVREALSHERDGVLRNVSAVFSGFSHYPETTDPKEYSEWQLIEMYGGRCFYHLEEHLSEVTHLVAHQGGTVKAAKAHQHGVPVVHTSWLLNCFAWFDKVPEEKFIMPVSATKETEDVQKLTGLHKPKRKAPGIALHHPHYPKPAPAAASSTSSSSPSSTEASSVSAANKGTEGENSAAKKRPRAEEEVAAPKATEDNSKTIGKDAENEDDEEDFLLAKLEEGSE